MARGNDPGKDFDDQWHASKRRGEYKASRGEGAWRNDKYLERLDARLGSGPVHHAGQKSCGEKTVILMAFLSGFGWVFSETVSRIV